MFEVWSFCLVLLAGSVADTPRQDFRMVTYYLALLKRAPAPPAQSAEEAAATQKAHIAHLEKLGRDGHGMAAGPFGDDGEIRGISILKADSPDHARTLQEADPAVKAGRLVVEVIPFLAPEGWFGKPAVPFEPDPLYFGFLVSGPTRGQDPATAAELQKQHLAYMTAQGNAGRLVLAGPIAMKEGPRRGVVVYRAGSLDEARALAEGDPMVKAGRLAVEIHPWMTAKGVLPLK
jgi:uncharacterized protein YciI